MEYNAGGNSVHCGGGTPSRAWTVALLVAAIAGCSNATDAPHISRIAVTPPTATLGVRDQLTLQASVFGGSGTVSGQTVYWSSEDSAVARVSSTGVVTAMAAGVVRIAASADGVYGAATITVAVEQVATVTLVPDTLRLTPTGAARLIATAYDGSGNIVNGLAVTWGSSNTAVATVDQTGAVTAVGLGTTSVSASIGGKIGSATVIVAPPPVATVGVVPDTLSIIAGTQGQLRATPYDAHGNPITGLPVTWSSGNNAIATVDATGIVTGMKRGTTAVSATIGGKVGSATVIVQPRLPGT